MQRKSMMYGPIKESSTLVENEKNRHSVYRRFFTIILVLAAIVGTTLLVSYSGLNGQQINSSKGEKVVSFSVPASETGDLIDLY